MISNLDELKFEGGYPTAETIEKLYDQLDLQRAAQAYPDFIPAMSMQAASICTRATTGSARPVA